MAAKPERAFSGPARPDWPEIDADRRKDWDMENCQDALGEIFGLFKLEGNPAKAKIEDAGAADTLVAKNSVGIGTGHGDALGLALDGEDARRGGAEVRGDRRGGCRGSRSDGCFGFIRCALGFDRNRLWCRGSALWRGSGRRFWSRRGLGARGAVAALAVVRLF